MTNESIDHKVSRFYGKKHLSPESAAALCQAAREAADSPLALPRRWRITPRLAAAAAIALTLAGILGLESRGSSLSSMLGIFQASPAKPVRGVSPADPVRDALPDAPQTHLTGGGELSQPEIIVLKFCADWCKPSLAIAPNYLELKNLYDAENVLFVELDLTDEAARQQVEMLITALGIEDVWNAHGGRTGEMLYVDASTLEILRTFTQEDLFQNMNVVLRGELDDRAGET